VIMTGIATIIFLVVIGSPYYLGNLSGGNQETRLLMLDPAEILKMRALAG